MGDRGIGEMICKLLSILIGSYNFKCKKRYSGKRCVGREILYKTTKMDRGIKNAQ